MVKNNEIEKLILPTIQLLGILLVPLGGHVTVIRCITRYLYYIIIIFTKY